MPAGASAGIRPNLATPSPNSQFWHGRLSRWPCVARIGRRVSSPPRRRMWPGGDTVWILCENRSNRCGRGFKAAPMHGTVHLFDRLPEVARPSGASGAAAPPVRAVPLVGVIRNPRSHRNTGTPPEWTGRATLLLETPAKRSELQAILERFAERRVDYIVVDGGDGTVRDVLTAGAGVFGEAWPPLIVLPNGKTNALAVDL